jgi:hypothetical protein
MMPMMNTRWFSKKIRGLALAALIPGLLCATSSAEKQKKDNIQKPMAGPRATALKVTWLYVSPNLTAQKVDRVQIGREMVVAEKSGAWLRVYANTDIEEVTNDRDTPLVGSDNTPTPISGWMEARGVVIETTADGDQVIMGEAANEEALASDPRGPANAAQIARLLYRRLVEMFPNSTLAAEAAWRAADIEWQIEKSDQASRPSSKEQKPYMREGMDEDAMKKVIKFYPHTKQADMAAYDLIDNKLCGDWQGQEKCPEKEAEYYEKYAAEHPDAPRAPKALYEAVYRNAVLVDMFNADNSDKKADEAKSRAHDLAGRLKDKFPQSDYTARAAALVFKLDQGIPVYGIDKQ